MIETLTYFLLFFLAFIIVPFSISPFEIPKVIISELLIEVIFILTIVKNIAFYPKKFNHIGLFAIIAIAVVVIVQIFLFHNTLVLFGNVLRLQGAFLLIHLLLFCILSSQVKLSKYIQLFAIVSFTFLLGTPLLFGTNAAGRFIGSLGEPNAFAAVVIFTWPFLLFYRNEKRIHVQRMMQVYGILGSILLLFLAQSRGAIVAFFLQGLLFVLLRCKKISIVVSLSLCFLLLGVSMYVTFISGGMTVLESRTEVWQSAFHAGVMHPLGGGIGNIQQLLHDASIQLTNNLRFQTVDSSHNIFLDWWIQTGLLGVGLFITLMFAVFIQLARNNNIREIILLMGLLTVLSFNPVSVTTLIALWWVIGQGLIKNSEHELKTQ